MRNSPGRDGFVVEGSLPLLVLRAEADRRSAERGDQSAPAEDREAVLHVANRPKKKARGDRYQLFRAPPDVMDAWDRWSRVLSATRLRSLNPRRAR